jgi:hypothetical protein
VLIDYDAANEYGALLRDTKTCNLVEAKGELGAAIADAEFAETKEAADEALKDAKIALDRAKH